MITSGSYLYTLVLSQLIKCVTPISHRHSGNKSFLQTKMFPSARGCVPQEVIIEVLSPQCYGKAPVHEHEFMWEKLWLGLVIENFTMVNQTCRILIKFYLSEKFIRNQKDLYAHYRWNKYVAKYMLIHISCLKIISNEESKLKYLHWSNKRISYNTTFPEKQNEKCTVLYKRQIFKKSIKSRALLEVTLGGGGRKREEKKKEKEKPSGQRN